MASLMPILQLLVPLAAILWFAFWPQRSLAALIMQGISALLITLGIGLVAIWAAIPQWIVIVLLAIWAFAAVRAYRQHDAARSGKAKRAWIAATIGLLLAATGSWLISEAIRGRISPGVQSIDLVLPLDGQDLIVANGGSRLLVNAHQDVLDPSVPRHRLWTGQAYAVDFMVLNRFGTSQSGWMPADPRRYAIFGRAVKAPCNGTVTRADDGRPDLKVPKVDPEVMQGNLVLLRCGSVEIAFAHLQQGSVAVRIGQAVKAGDLLGKVGNSGYSAEPHLHINAQTAGTAAAPFSGRPVAMRFNGRFLARNDRP